MAVRVAKLVLECIWDPHFGGRGGRIGSAMVPFERAMVVFYRLSIVTIALSVTIWPAAICQRMYPTLKSTEGGSFWDKFGEEGVDRRN